MYLYKVNPDTLCYLISLQQMDGLKPLCCYHHLTIFIIYWRVMLSLIYLAWSLIFDLGSDARYSLPIQLKQNFFSLRVFLRSCISFFHFFTFTGYTQGLLSFCFVCNSCSSLWSSFGYDLTGLRSILFQSFFVGSSKSRSFHLSSVLTRSDLILGSLSRVDLT